MSQPAGSDLRELAATEVVFPCVDRERVEQLVSDALGLPRRPGEPRCRWSGRQQLSLRRRLRILST